MSDNIIWQCCQIKEIRTWIIDYTHTVIWGVITHSYPNFNGDLTVEQGSPVRSRDACWLMNKALYAIGITL